MSNSVILNWMSTLIFTLLVTSIATITSLLITTNNKDRSFESYQHARKTFHDYEKIHGIFFVLDNQIDDNRVMYRTTVYYLANFEQSYQNLKTFISQIDIDDKEVRISVREDLKGFNQCSMELLRPKLARLANDAENYKSNLDSARNGSLNFNEMTMKTIVELLWKLRSQPQTTFETALRLSHRAGESVAVQPCREYFAEEFHKAYEALAHDQLDSNSRSQLKAFFSLFNEYREQIKDDSRATLYEKLKQHEAKFKEVEKAYFGLAKVTLANLPLMELSSAIYWLLMSQVILIWILVLLYPFVPIIHAETPNEFIKSRFFVFPFEANTVFQKIIVETPWLLYVGLSFYLARLDENPINILISTQSSESLVFKNYHTLSLWLGIGYGITFLERWFFQSILKNNKPIG